MKKKKHISHNLAIVFIIIVLILCAMISCDTQHITDLLREREGVEEESTPDPTPEIPTPDPTPEIPTPTPTPPTPTPTPTNRPPDPPSNPQPPDGATGVILTPELCADLSDPDGDTMYVTITLYDIEYTLIGDDSEVGSSGDRVCTGLPGILCGKTYIWTAEASDLELSASSTFSFTTKGIQDLISNPHPADGSTGVSTNPTLSVNVNYLTGLGVEFWGREEDSGPFNKIGTDSAAQSFPASVIWNNLDYSTTYEWYVMIDGCGKSDTWTFTTRENHAPDPPSNPQPPDGAWEVGTDPDLCVDVSDPDGDPMDVIFYDMMDVPIETAEQVPSGETACVQWHSLSPNSPYAWSAEAYDGDKSTKSPQWSFNTGPTPTPGPAVHCELSGTTVYVFLRNAPACEGGELTIIECDVEINQNVTDIVGEVDWNQYGTHVTVRFYCEDGPDFVIQGIDSIPTNFELNGTPIRIED